MMKKEIILLGALAFLVIGLFVFRAEALGEYYILNETIYEVSTTNGTDSLAIILPIGTLIGGAPTGKYITLTQGMYLPTTSGIIFVEEDEEIDCNPPPGYPNPCNPYGG